MQLNKFLPAVVVLFAWGFLFDKFLASAVYGSAFSQVPGLVAEPSMQWILIGSLVGCAVLVWVYEKVRGSFAAGASGGVMFGLYTGILMNFPLWLFHTIYTAWPYKAMWQFTVVNIVLSVINGALIGLVYQKVGGAKTA